MGISKDNPIRNNKDIVKLFELVLNGFDLHTFVLEGFGEENPKYGELAGRVVALLGMMMILERKHPELEKRFAGIVSELTEAQRVALTEIELTCFKEMEMLDLI